MATPSPPVPAGCHRRRGALGLAVLGGALALWLLPDESFVLARGASSLGGQAAPAGFAEGRRHAPARTSGAGTALRRGAGLTTVAAAEDEAAAAEAVEAPPKPIKVTALGNARGCFVLEMGGQKLLINPNLEGLDEFPPEKIHEMFDYVVVTSAQDEFCHPPTLLKMNLAKVNFVAAGSAGEKLSQMLVKNLAVLAPGPGGRALLSGDEGTTPLAVLVTPGAQIGMPWDAPESGFIFVDLQTGVAVAYEAMGQYLGAGASSTRDGIPEEAYQVDYVITPDLREAAGTVTGLTAKGAVLRGVVALPSPGATAAEEASSNPLLMPLLALDRAADAALGGVGEDPDEFRAFLSKEGGTLADTRVLSPAVGGEAVTLE